MKTILKKIGNFFLFTNLFWLGAAAALFGASYNNGWDTFNLIGSVISFVAFVASSMYVSLYNKGKNPF